MCIEVYQRGQGHQHHFRMPGKMCKIIYLTYLTVIVCLIPTALGFDPAMLDRKGDLSCVREYKNASIGFYRLLVVSQDNKTLYVGAKNNILQLSLFNVSKEIARKHLPANSESYRKCDIQRENPAIDCQNHIRLIIEQGNSTLFVCGTGAFAPTKYNLTVNQLNNGTNLSENDNAVGKAGIAMCPYDPFDNATALYVTKGNPDNIPSMYFGTNSDFLKNYPLFFRPALYNSSGVKVYAEKMTDKFREKWLNAPQFVKSYDVNEEVFLFFREKAVEKIDSPSFKIYSRVAKVCKEDVVVGRDGDSSIKWMSFQKSRLICALPGDSPFYFDDIYDVWSDDTETFYALFYKQGAFLHSSAICKYRKTDIYHSFNGKYKYYTGTDTNGPNPRPGNCTLHKTPEVFSSSNQLENIIMDKNVEPVYGEPIYVKPSVQLLRIVGERVKNGTVLYAASSDSKIYHIMVQETPTSYSTNLAAVYDMSSNSHHPPIWNMQLVNDSLYVGTDESVMQLNLSICSMLKRIEPCLYNGHCKWNGCRGMCVQIDSGSKCSKMVYLQNVTKETPLFNTLQNLDLVANETEVLQFYSGLYYTLKLNTVLSPGEDLKWYYNKEIISTQGYSSKYILTGEGDLMISNLTESDKGVYTAKIKANVVRNIRLVYDIGNKESLKEAWKQGFMDWASHFQKWKSCTQPYLDSCKGGGGGYCMP